MVRDGEQCVFFLILEILNEAKADGRQTGADLRKQGFGSGVHELLEIKASQ